MSLKFSQEFSGDVTARKGLQRPGAVNLFFFFFFYPESRVNRGKNEREYYIISRLSTYFKKKTGTDGALGLRN